MERLANAGESIVETSLLAIWNARLATMNSKRGRRSTFEGYF